MSKYCTKCGAKLDDFTEFCASCGAPCEQSQQQTAYQPAISGVKERFTNLPDWHTVINNDKVKVAGLAVIGIIVVVVVLNLLIKPYENPIDNLVDGFNDSDYSTLTDAFAPDLIKKFSSNYDDAEGKVEESLKEYITVLEKTNGSDVVITYFLINKDKLSDEQLDNIVDTYKSADCKLKLKKGYSLDIRFKITGDDATTYATYNIDVAKEEDDGWVIVDVNNLISDYLPYVKSSSLYSLLNLSLSSRTLGGSDSDYDDYTTGLGVE